ncbi:hypothetical protein N9H39_09675, partial [Gammaproteobacteria bacterium]|nr:hypothetical protein [Gammaproteobacteria bacterium]
MSNRLEDLKNITEQTRESWTKVYALITSHSSVNPSATYEFLDSSLSEYNEGVLAILELTDSITLPETNRTPDLVTFSDLFKDVITTLSNTRKNYENIVNQLTGASVDQVNTNNFTYQTSN